MSAEPIPRPRVEGALRDAVASAALTVLSAPLGAGKTTAAKMTFANEPAVVWLEARPWHRDAFVRDVVEAVRSVRPDFGRMTLGSLEAGASPPHVGRTFARELAHIDESLIIVVDNVHVFTGESAFVRFVDAVVAELPPSVRILAMGRSLPQIELGRTFASGKGQLLDDAMLAFDPIEIRAYLQSAGRDANDAAVAQIEARTEGWAAGLALDTSRRGAEAYLTKGLLAKLERSDLAFLETASVLETLDANAAARLRKMGAPLSEAPGGALRLHPALREIAERRLRKRGTYAAAHRDAAAAFLNAGALAPALFHIEQSADPALAATFLREHAGSAIAAGHGARVKVLAARVDPESGDAAVRLFTEALLEKPAGTGDVRDAFELAMKSAETSDDASIAFGALAQLVEYDMGHLRPVDGHDLERLRRSAQALGPSERATAAVMRGWSLAIAGDFAGALDAVVPLAQQHDAAVRFNADVLAAYALTSLGRVEAAEGLLDALTTRLENGDRVVLQTLTLVWFARLALLWGNTTAAGDAAAQAERLASALDLRADEAALYLVLADVATHQGRIEDAVRYAERAKSRSGIAWYAGDVERARAFAEIVLARAAFLGHDNAIARELAERVASNESTPPVQRAVARTEAAIYTLLSEPPASAAAIARAREAIWNAVPIDAADAVALACADETLAFLDTANGVAHVSALNTCEPFAALIEARRGLVTLEHAGVAVGNARRGLAEGSVAFDTALDRLTRNGQRFEARLARAYAASFVRERRSAPPVAPNFDLTARESEILTLLVDGLTNKEIAQRLVLSPRTVETHVERVLGKLEVGSRSRAIAKALRMGLVVMSPEY